MRTLIGSVLAYISIAAALAQSTGPNGQNAARNRMTFEVASIKPSKKPRMPRFPLGAGNAYAPGGRFSATFPLWTYITFAYKLSPTETEKRLTLAHSPEWVSNELFAIDAIAAGNPTKDEMRLMMRSLLADRFRLAVHFETRELPVFALTLLKSGKTGPNLRPHDQGPPCPGSWIAPVIAAGRPNPKDVFPPNCGTAAMSQRSGVRLIASRDTTMALLADAIYGYGFMAGEVDKRVVDGTGLSGSFDFRIEYTPGENDTFVVHRGPSNPDAPPPDPGGTPFLTAMRNQLGLKLVPSRAPVRLLIIDHVEPPSEN